ncbi:MAG: hypothetical protein RLZZ338_201 [Cyanobacteriota bacterium]|jgi:hypothetical protein
MNKNLVWVSLLFTSFVVSYHPYSAASVSPPLVPSSTETPKETPPSHKNTLPETQIITKEDLPPGFEEDLLLKNFMEKSMSSMKGEFSAFAFVKNQKSRIQIMGLIQELPPFSTQKEKEDFDKFMQTDFLANVFVSSLTRPGETVPKAEPLILTKKFGNAAKGWTTQTKIKDISSRLDVVTFRRDRFFGLVVFMYMNETPETLNISDIASKMDQRLMTIMPTIPPSQNPTDLKEKEK